MKPINKVKLGLIALLASSMWQSASAATTYHRVSWDSDPASSAVIGFSPDGSSNSPYIQYGQTTDESQWVQKNPTSSDRFSSLDSYFVRLTNLTANSPVYYRVCDSSGCGQRFWFKTAPTDNSPYVFVAGGDTRTGHTTRRQGNQLIAKLRPLFIMHGGDFTDSNNTSQMKAFLSDWALTYSSDTINGQSYKRIYPLIPTHGNHEDGNYSTLCEVFGVDYNQDGNCDPKDTFGAFNISPLLRAYTLNSQFKNSGWSSYATMMNNWLTNDLSTQGSNATWRIGQYHKPIFPHYTGKSENYELFEWWADLFYNHAMNVVVESDTHINKLTQAVKPGGSNFTTTTSGGTVFVGEGSWGAPARSANDAKSWTIDMASIQQFKVISVTNSNMQVRTAQFNSGASTLSREQRMNDPLLLPSNVSWWSANQIGDVMNLVQSAQGRSIIDTGTPNTPTADFSFTKTELTVQFSDNSSDDGSITSRAWDFGDGQSSSQTSPTHNYASAGTYQVKLTVTDNDGLSDNVSKSVTVSETPTGDNELENGVSITANGNKGDEKFYYVNIPDNAKNLRFVTSGGTGDVDLYTRFGQQPTTSNYDCRPYKNGNSETCEVASPSAGQYFVMLRAYSSYSNATLTATYEVDDGTPDNELINGVPKSNLQDAKYGESHFYINVPSSSSQLTVTINGGSGDADLYVQFGVQPTTSDYDCRPYKYGNSETCTISNVSTGVYHVMLRGYTSYNGVTLEASY